MILLKPNKFKIIPAAALIAAVGIFASFPVQAQERELLNRLNRLENEIQTLNDAVYKGQKPAFDVNQREGGAINTLSPSSNAQAEIRMNALEQELRELTGRVEELNYKNSQLQAQVESFIADSNLRFQDLEGGALATPTEPTVSGMKSVEVTNPKPDLGTLQKASPQDDKTLGVLSDKPEGSDPAALYEEAFMTLRQGRYQEAEKSFKEFLSMYPKHEFASNAQYWLSESFYARGQYEKAAQGFAKGYQTYPKAPKKADNLLKLGLSLAQLDKKSEACVTLQQLENEVPDAPSSIKTRAKQEQETLGCS
ncbi:MAG: tol-pal system protein YbgF [Micavibrio sp.]|mgnify:CR=1 FL=1|nr:tol-pal system protein YbgF [Micavibrio sp.]